MYVVAEAGVNHDGIVDRALKLVDAAAAGGADAVKFQIFDVDRLVTEGTAKAAYQRRADGGSETQDEMLRRLQLDLRSFEAIAGRARARGVAFLASPFDEESVDVLVELGVPAIKIASPDLVNLPLVAYAAATGLPLILSTGMADLEETRGAVGAARAAGAEELVVLHCVSAYPARPEDANLAAMATLADALDVPIGFSDHTLGTAVAVAAAALGACLVEKHLTLDRTAPGPDHAASIEPREFADLVAACRAAAAAIGDGVKRPVAAELENIAFTRRSVAAAHDLPAGSVITRSSLVALRPGTGIPAASLESLVGRTLAREVPALPSARAGGPPMSTFAELAGLSGRRALVAGGAGHIGAVAAETLAELGAAVAVCDLDAGRARVVAGEVGGIAVPVDLRDEQEARHAVREVVAELGGVDVLVHAAALVGTSSLPGWAVPFGEQSVEAWDEALRVNLTSVFVLVQEARDALAASGHGAVVLFGSIYASVGPDPALYKGTSMANPVAYGASKGGLLQLMRYLASELAPRVRVNAISPGGIERRQPAEFRRRYAERNPLGRMATESDMKGAVAFLASDLSAYVTGHELVVDGGWTVR